MSEESKDYDVCRAVIEQIKQGETFINKEKLDKSIAEKSKIIKDNKIVKK